jgi:quercetin dioxygenase-like cupin family protein
MKVVTLSEAEKIPGLNSWKMFTCERTELIHLVLGPDEILPLHSNPFDVIFYVLKGSGLLTVEGESSTLRIHDTVDVPAGKQREWKNQGKEELKLLVIKIL